MLYGILLFFIGVVQVLGAIIRIICAKRQNSQYAIRLKQYLLFVLVFFFINYLLIEADVPEYFLFSYLFVIPPFVAIWHWHHVSSWARKHKRIKEFDKIRFAKKDHLLLEVPCQERLELDMLPKRKVQLISWNGNLIVAQ